MSPNAKKNKILGLIELHQPKLVKIAVAAPPTDGKANKELVNFLGQICDAPKSSIWITKGQYNGTKQVVIAADVELQQQVVNKLQELIDSKKHAADNQLFSL